MKRSGKAALKIAPIVTPEDARVFAEEWRDGSWEGGILTDAFAATRLMQWPTNAGAGGQETPEELRYNEIENEILKRMLDVVQPVIEAAFLRAAIEVLDRERCAAREHRANVLK